MFCQPSLKEHEHGGVTAGSRVCSSGDVVCTLLNVVKKRRSVISQLLSGVFPVLKC